MNYPGSNPSGFSGFPPTSQFSNQSRQLGQATAQLRTNITARIVNDNEYEIDRLTRYYLFWKFYEGNHYRDFNDGMLAFNYVRAFIDKVNMFLLGKDGFSFQVKRFDSDIIDKEVEKMAEKLILRHWNKSRKSIVAHELLQMGSIAGDVWFGPEWQEEGRYCKIRVFDSRHCFPYFKDGDFNQMESFCLRFPLSKDDKQGNPNGYLLKVYEYTKDNITTWFQKDLSYNKNSVKKFQESSEKNPYGFIPVVHIKNRPNSADYYGKSDANDILKINKVYNEMMQQEKAIIDYHATPTTVITGGTAKNLRRGLGNIWSGLPPEANVFNLGLDVDLTATDNFIKSLKVGMHELSDVPENTLGKIQAISNTSAAALNITYQPLVQQADLKALTYGEGIAQVNTMILKMIKVHDENNEMLKALETAIEDFIDDTNIVPVFTYGLPSDRQNELNMAVTELSNKLASRREILERLGKNNVPELLEEIEEDQITLGALQQMSNFSGDEGIGDMGTAGNITQPVGVNQPEGAPPIDNEE